jgi:hypothetical protein
MKNSALIVAGIIFSLIALIHFLRLIYHWKIIIAGYIVPMSVSTIGLFITLILAIWMFTAMMKN